MGKRRSLVRDCNEYGISDHGDVYSYKRGKFIVLKPGDNGNGYKFVKLRIGNKSYTYYVHRLVADAFIKRPEGSNEVNHKDGNKSNNNYKNLEWVSRRENMRHAFSVLGHKGPFEGKTGIRHPRSMPIISINIKTGIKKKHVNAVAASKYVKGWPTHICSALKGKMKEYKGHRWEYIK